VLELLFADRAPLDLRIVGKTLLHAAAVGAGAGLLGSLLFVAFELLQRLLLEEFAGYVPLRAAGETFAAGAVAHEFRPWALLVLPALGGLACGLITRLAPEARGGGGDAMISAFHNQGGAIRPRVIWVKALASMCTLGSGGAGGREGPTMQIGGALGAWVSGLLRVSPRERRLLMVAGVAAGVAAVFRTPLGAALLAAEVLYRDGFESDALVPSVLASVVAYSVTISIFGQSTLFGHVPHFEFVPSQLPLFALLAVLVAGVAVVFVAAFHASERLFARAPGPDWLRPALGGLALGAFVTPVLILVGNRMGAVGQGFGILGGGYGAVQMAISGSTWLPVGWAAVGLLGVLALVKLFAAAITIGSGGSAGDFAPSLAIGGLLGGAFGRAAQLLLDDARISPAAFALVGMGTFYGGIAHVPLSALVLVCELAGNYDLLVPLMLCQGIAFVALRRRALYRAQVETHRESPTHRDVVLLGALRAVEVQDLMKPTMVPVCFSPTASTAELIGMAADAPAQEIFPVLNESGALVGVVTAETIRVLAAEIVDTRWTLAADLMQTPITVTPDDDIKTAIELMLQHSLRELPVVSPDGHVIGLLDEADIASMTLTAAARAEAADPGAVENRRKSERPKTKPKKAGA
jgi:chloride channel protein, CIC family